MSAQKKDDLTKIIEVYHDAVTLRERARAAERKAKKAVSDLAKLVQAHGGEAQFVDNDLTVTLNAGPEAGPGMVTAIQEGML